MEVVDGYPLVLTTRDEPRLGREDGHAQDARRVVGRELDSLDRLRRLAPRPQVDAVDGQSSVYPSELGWNEAAPLVLSGGDEPQSVRGDDGEGSDTSTRMRLFSKRLPRKRDLSLWRTASALLLSSISCADSPCVPTSSSKRSEPSGEGWPSPPLTCRLQGIQRR